MGFVWFTEFLGFMGFVEFVSGSGFATFAKATAAEAGFKFQVPGSRFELRKA
jgi:hypothetical protein